MAIFQDNRDLLGRLRWLRFIFILFLTVITVKLWYLTVLEYKHFEAMAEQNHVRTIPLLAPRGLIFDRDGRVLADNGDSFNLLFYRDEVGNFDSAVRFLVEALYLDRQKLTNRLEATKDYATFQPVVVKENLNLEDISYLLSHQAEQPGLKIFRQPRRSYPHGQLAAHVLGYVGEVSPRQLETGEFARSRPGDIVGKFGLERTYNELLKGEDGARRVLVNSRGKTLQEVGRIEPVKGTDLRTTLDLDLQRMAESELADSPGAVVALNPQTGEILALTSHPAFDPNLFAVRISRADWNELINNPDNPFQNRVIQSTFSPGSIFKVVMALAALESEAIDPHFSVYCNGGAELYGHYFRCWKKGGHGHVNLRSAIQYSCNVFFYQLGQKLGIERIASFSRHVGLGLPTGIDLYGEARGLVPSEQWKLETTGQRWYAGETISVAIGQGPLHVTPIQLARAIGVIATGEAPDLRLTRDTAATSLASPVALAPPYFDEKDLQAVRDGMWAVVNEWGTGRGAWVRDFEVCGKTGTAQTIGSAARSRLSSEELARFEANAWFVGFAPRDNPEIVVAVIVQRGGSGSSRAAPIAGKILDTYYRKYKLREDAPDLKLVHVPPGGDPARIL